MHTRSLSLAIQSRVHIAAGLNKRTSPIISLLSSIAITDTGGSVTATIDNGCLETVWSVEYGLTNAYGTIIPGGTITEKTIINKELTGLTNNKNYHWRIKAENSEGSTYSNDYTFFTTAFVTIGTQRWTKGFHQSNITAMGTTIPLMTSAAEWSADTTPRCCWYAYSSDNSARGLYFNLSAVQLMYNDVIAYNQANPSNFIPFRPAIKDEFIVLRDYLGGATVAGGKLKESGTSHWSAPNTGATDDFGLSLWGNGLKHYSTEFSSINTQEYIWGADGSDILLKNTDASLTVANIGTHNANYGFTLRMIGIEPIFLISAGQSNIDGRVPQIDAPIWLNQSDPSLENVSVWKNTTSEYLQFKLGLNTGSYTNASTLWAFDMVTYYLMQQYKKSNVFVVKKSVGGTAISELGSIGAGCWNADFNVIPVGTAKLLQLFETYITHSIEHSGLTKSHIKAFLWHQGEGDYSEAAAPFYYNNLKAVISSVRAVVGNSNLPFVMGSISHNSAQYNSIVEAAQQQIASEDSNVYLVDMSAGTLLDSYHFDAATSENLGTSVFNIIKDF